MATPTIIKLCLNPGQVRPFSMDGASLDDLAMLGLQFPAREIEGLRNAYPAFSMDADGIGSGPRTVNLASCGVPVQFLQTLLPGTVRAVTSARKIDDLVGRTIAGNWEDEEIVQTVVELTGRARPYGDYAPGPLANYTTDFERRTVVRFEMDMEVPVLEEARAGRIRQNSGELKRSASAQALAVEHNRIGFFGYADGECRTYGLLNDPNLPDYITVPAGASGSTEWRDKTFEEITEDLMLAASHIRTTSGEVVDPEKAPCVLAVSTSVRDFLKKTSDREKTVKQWLQENYPNWRLESAPELDGANGGANVFYLYAEEIPGGDSENGTQKAIEQFVPAVFRLLGVERRAKGVYEAYSSATAGIMAKIPFAVARYTGV